MKIVISILLLIVGLYCILGRKNIVDGKEIKSTIFPVALGIAFIEIAAAILYTLFK